MLPYHVRNAAVVARKEKERKDAIEREYHARLARLSADDYFFLRATESGYNMDIDVSKNHVMSTRRTK